MHSGKMSYQESLARNVVALGKCVGCGTCVLTCPFDCLELIDEKPRLKKECKVCGICARTCPRYLWSWSDATKFVFGRERKPDEEFGVYRRFTVAQASDARILKGCQDGGVVTALLLFALENGLVDGAIVAGTSPEKPLLPIPKLTTTGGEILECAGTKYCYSPNILALAEVAKQKLTNLIFVGTPCEIQAVRKMQMSGLKKYAASIKCLIGLMCSECFTYEGLMEKHIHETLGLDLSGIRKMNIKGKMLVKTESGDTSISLAEAKRFAKQSCRFCDDFSSELADISCGGLGLNGWTFTILRTEKGEELFSKAEKVGAVRTRKVNEDALALSLLSRITKRKRQASSSQRQR